MIELKNVLKKYSTRKEEVVSLKGINLTLPKTGFICILGASGSGKSTLLNIIGGLLKPTSGEVIVDGKNISTFKEKDYDYYRNHYIGFVFQDYNLIEDYTVYENINIALELQQKKGKGEIEELLKKLGISKLKRRKASELSGGEKQRVAIARALIKKPKIVLADEPTGNLDSKTGIEIMNLLKEMSKTTLVIMVTHNQEQAATYADRIIEIRDGQVIDDAYLDKEEQEEKGNYEIVRSKLPLFYSLKLGILSLFQSGWKNLTTILILSFLSFCILFIYYLSTYSERKVIFNALEKETADTFKIGKIKDTTGQDLDEEDYNQLSNFQGGVVYTTNMQSSASVFSNVEIVEDYFTHLHSIQGSLPKTNREIILTSSLLEEVMNTTNQTDMLGKEILFFEDTIKIVGVVEGKENRIYAIKGFVESLKSYKEIGLNKNHQYVITVPKLKNIIKNIGYIENPIQYYNGVKWQTISSLQENEMLLSIADIHKGSEKGNSTKNKKEIEKDKKITSYIGQTVDFNIFENLEVYLSGMNVKPNNTYDNIQIIGIVMEDNKSMVSREILSKYQEYTYKKTGYLLPKQQVKKIKNLKEYTVASSKYDFVYELKGTIKSFKEVLCFLLIAFLLFTMLFFLYFTKEIIKSKRYTLEILKKLGCTRKERFLLIAMEEFEIIFSSFLLGICFFFICLLLMNHYYQTTKEISFSLFYTPVASISFLLFYLLILFGLLFIVEQKRKNM